MRVTPPLDLASLVPSWLLTLRAEHKSDETVKTYRDGVAAYLAWCAAEGQPAVLDRAQVQAWSVGLLDAGRAPATVRSRQLAVRRFAAWLVDEGELADDPLAGLRPARLDRKIVEPLTDDELRALLKACAGRELRDRRDEAIVRFMAETGARAGEVVALTVADVDVHAGTATIRRGKGGKGRVVPFGAQTSLAIDRYLRVRRTHRLAGTPALWLGDRGKAFSYDGLYVALRYRARLAGIEGFRPHRLRHTAASRWLAAGGSEQGLMTVAGWSRPDMLLRYTQARAADRAVAEARNLNLGDL